MVGSIKRSKDVIKEKLLQRLLSKPKDFTWEELIGVLAMFGFSEKKNGKTGGSRRKFVNKNLEVISLHEPHPGNIIKRYVLDQLIEFLQKRNYLQDE
ncbi:type II toxin-antitoxin system HicA family toxin [Flavihumibacter petaseus]|uniref:Putative toxin-antitoxin system toxin component n=1 Tax=Flavihumibacter petaseus NBRC 106054 TaxID=1220578 RepID=A0A0E9N0M3_9BACT|nr:putative toxin-antitoxin system toxin component [Flavihumibacter petaseus NBRC 106054]